MRVSTDKQTVANQRDEIQRYCESNGLRVDQEMELEISSRKSDTERGIDTLKENLTSGSILICSELSRLGRNTASVIVLINELVAKGVRVILIKQGMDIRDNDMSSKIMVTMFSLFAELERDFVSLRTKEALAMRKRAGMVLGRPKGTKGKSKYTEYKSRIQALLTEGVSVRKIALQHLPELELKNPTGLHDYIKAEALTA
ncbi:recombinase family protein [Lentisphaera profundi]|uniref:Recombinase family protein n=1 Tax=Lentisphaera profundi TaxID=1658616 RepID=A0ABY7VXJ4_9BACT|nr:recombinase family protein [Lentisphaera profundi]WDE97449.1 recombinase family protein [Lentisphaera profundi]